MKTQEQIKADLAFIVPFAAHFVASHESSAADNRAIIEMYCREFKESSEFAVGAIQSLLLRRSGVVGKSDEDTSHALLLLASFMQGVVICERSIAEGYYLVASVLLRHELETVAALEELEQGIRTEGSVPNVKHAKWGLARNYGRLSTAAHSTSDNLLRETLVVDGSRYGLHGRANPVSIMPVHDANHSWDLWAMHVTLILQAARHFQYTFQKMYGEGFNEAEDTALTSAYSYIVDSGWLKKDPTGD